MGFLYNRKSFCLILTLIAGSEGSASLSSSSIITSHDDDNTSRHRLPLSPVGTIFGDPTTHRNIRSHDASASSSSGWLWSQQPHQSSHQQQKQQQQLKRNNSVETAALVNDYDDEESSSSSSRQTVSDLFRTIGQFWVSRLDIPSIIPSLLSSVIDGPSLIDETNGDSSSSNNNIQNPITISLRRSLQKSDFDDLNNILKSVTILIPDTTIKTKVLWNTLDLDLKNIKCYDISLHDLIISFQKKSNKKITVPIEIVGLDMWCELDWRYDWGIFHDGGSAQMYSNDNSAKTTLAFSSGDFGSMAPNGSSVESCVTNIVITDIDIQGDFIAKVINAMEKSIRGTISNAIEDVLCEELGSLGSSKVSDMLGVVNDMIENYKAPLSPSLKNPLTAEYDLVSSAPDVTLLDMTTTNESIGTWFNRALSEIDSMMGRIVDDPQSPSGNGKDLGINKLLRSTILDSSRTYLIPVSQWPSSIGNDGVILDSHDKISQTTIVLNNLRVRGLDTFSVFDPMNTIGLYTLSNSFKMEYLEVEADLTVTMRPSSHSGAVMVNPGGEPQVERLTVSTKLKNIALDTSFLLAIDQELLGNVHLGSLLTKKFIMPCVMPTLHQMQLTGLSVSIDDIETPRMVGFVDAGLDRVIKTATELAFVMYKTPLLQALPNVFQTTVRDSVNNFLTEQMTATDDDDDDVECPIYDDGGRDDVVIDYRDLFWSPSKAYAMGGSGLSPYGDVGSMMMNLLEEHLLSASDGDGELSKINARVIRPFTKSQSGIDGMLRFNESDIVNIQKDFSSLLWSSMLKSLEFRLFDGRLENIDTVRDLSIFQPNRDNYMALDNSMAMGIQHESHFHPPFISRIRTLFDLGGDDDDSPLAMRNDLDITITIPSMELTSNLILPLLEKNLMTFPLKSITNGHCWLASLSSNNDVATTAIITFLLSLPSILQLDISCISCSSPGLHILSDVIDIIDQSGGIDFLTNRLLIILDDVLRGEYIREKLHRMIVDAPKKCPHSETFQDPGEDWPALDGPALTQDMLELGLLTGTILLHATMAIVAESHSDAYVSTPDPLAAQNELLDVLSSSSNSSTAAELIDFTNLTSSLGVMGSFADAALGQINERLGEMVEDTTEGPNFDMTGEDLYINVVLRERLLDDDRALTLPIIGDGYRLDTGDLSLALRAVRIKGLDTFKELHVLDPIGRQTLMNEWRWHHLDFDVELAVKPTTATGRRLLASKEEQIISLSFGIDDIDATVAFLFALDLHLLGNIELGSVLHLDRILPCLLSASHAVQFSQLSLSIGDMREPTIKGFLSDSAYQAIKKTTTALFNEYKSQIVASTPAFFDQTVRPLLNQILEGFVTAESNRSCPRPSSSFDDYVNFHDLFLSADEAAASGGSGTSPYGNVFSHLMTIVDNHVLATSPQTGLSKINDLLFVPMTQSQSNTSGTLRYPGDLFGGATNIDVGGFKATVDLRAFDATLEHVDSVGEPLRLFDPVEGEGSSLENTATFGVGGKALRVSVGLLISIIGSDDDLLQMRNELIVSMDLTTATILAKTIIKMKENLFLSFPLRDITNLNCWLATMPSSDLNAYGIRSDPTTTPSFHLQELAIAISQLELDVECISCTSPGFEELAETLSQPAAVKDATLIGNKVINYLTSMAGGEYLAVKIDQLLYNARKSCPHHDSYDPNYIAPAAYKPLEVPDYTVDSMSFLMALLVVGFLLFAFIGVAAVMVKRYVKRRHERWMATLSPDELYNVRAEQEKEEREERDLSQRTKSMALSEAIPFVVRVLMPFIILGNIGLFLSGHLSLGATVSIKAEVAGEELLVNDFFKFSMAYSIQEMWQAGAKSLAVLILVFSGVWPYTKQTITFVLWFLPPTRCSATKRGRIFLWLDGFAKWSMVDIFVLLTTLAAFRITINSPEGLAFLPDGFYSVDLAVIPLWGLYANMLAQLISQVSSHFIIYYHRCVVASATTTTSSSDGDKLQIAAQDTPTTADETKPLEPLYKHSYQTDFHSNGRHAHVHRNAIPTLIILALAVTTLIIVGCTLHSFTLEVLGLIGIAVESGQQFQPATTSHNVFSLVGVIMEEARFLDVGRYYVGLGTLAALLVLTTLIVPIVQAWGLVGQWLAPLSKRGRYRVHVAIECLAAWQYVEVYILSVIITAWQISGVSSFMVNAYCGSLTTTFKQLAYYGIIDNADAQCFSVEATLEDGIYALIVAAIVLGCLNHFVCKAAEQRDREERSSESVRTVGCGESSQRDDWGIDKSDEVSEVRSTPVRFTDTYRFFLTMKGDDNDENTVTDKSSLPAAVCCFAVPPDSPKAFESKTCPPQTSCPGKIESSKEDTIKVDPEVV